MEEEVFSSIEKSWWRGWKYQFFCSFALQYIDWWREVYQDEDEDDEDDKDTSAIGWLFVPLE